MADTTFSNGITLTDSDWFNDVNRLHYTIFGDPTNLASAQAAFFSAGAISLPSTLSVSGKSTFAAIAVGGVLSATAIAGAVIATQAQMESAASSDAVVTPLRLHFHPAAAKAWARFAGNATSVTAAAAYNVTSITDDGTGRYTINFTTPFSSGSYAPAAISDATNTLLASVSAGSATVRCLDLNGTAVDASIVSFIAFGDV